jgi:hypothetical protein
MPHKRKVGHHPMKQLAGDMPKNPTKIFEILEGDPSENPREEELKKQKDETKKGTKNRR